MLGETKETRNSAQEATFWESDAALDTFFPWIGSQRAPESSNPGVRWCVASLNGLHQKFWLTGLGGMAWGLWVARSSHNLSGSTVWSLGQKPPLQRAMHLHCKNFLIRFGSGKPKHVGARTSSRSFARRGKHIMQWWIELIILQVLDPRTERVLHFNENLKKLAYFFKSKAHQSLESECFTSSVSCILPGIFLASELFGGICQNFCWGTWNRYFHDGHVWACRVEASVRFVTKWKSQLTSLSRFNTLMILMSPSCPSLQARFFRVWGGGLFNIGCLQVFKD